MRAEWPLYADAKLYEINYDVDTIRSRVVPEGWWVVDISPRWLESASRAVRLMAYTTPDLRSAAGWNPNWTLSGDYGMEWTVGAYRANVSARELLRGVYKGVMLPFADGANVTYAASGGAHY
jgi:hypothetical protein